MRTSAFCVAIASVIVGTHAASFGSTSSWDGTISEITCDQNPKLKFTLDEGQNVSNSEVSSLCACIWEKVDVGGWEREALDDLASGRDPGLFKKQGALGRFNQAVTQCSDGKFMSETVPPSSSSNSSNGGSGTNKPSAPNDEPTLLLQVLGFAGGGPIGIWASPQIYRLASGNLIIWGAAGLFLATPLWYMFIAPLVLLWSILFPNNKN